MKNYRHLNKILRLIGDAIIVIAFVLFLVFAFTIGAVLLLEISY